LFKSLSLLIKHTLKVSQLRGKSLITSQSRSTLLTAALLVRLPRLNCFSWPGPLRQVVDGELGGHVGAAACWRLCWKAMDRNAPT